MLPTVEPPQLKTQWSEPGNHTCASPLRQSINKTCWNCDNPVPLANLVLGECFENFLSIASRLERTPIPRLDKTAHKWAKSKPPSP